MADLTSRRARILYSSFRVTVKQSFRGGLWISPQANDTVTTVMAAVYEFRTPDNKGDALPALMVRRVQN